MEQEKKTAGMPCPPCKSAPFSRAVKPAAQENAVQEAAAPLGAPGQYGGSAVGRTEKTPGFTGVDAAFACGYLAVGWLFWELQLWSGWRWFGNAGTGTALFTALFAGAVLAYVYLAKLRPPRESWFWLAVLLCLGLGYALPYGGGLLGAVHYGALLFTAEYWTLSATGRLLKSGKTSNWLPLDVLNALFVLPWGNFMRLPAAFVFGLKGLGRRVRAARSEPGERSRGKRLLGVLGGVALALLAGAVAGGFWGMIPGVLKIGRGQNEMIISIMLNYVATLFMGVIYTSWIRDASVPQTPAIADEVHLPRIITGMRFTWGFVIAVAVGLILYYVLFWTSAGFRLRAVGCNLTASRFNGIPVKRFMLASFIVSGAIAGLGGGAELLGTQFRLINGYGAGYGFDGVAMALIGQLHPIATMVVALFFAVLRVGSTTMQAATGVPTSVSDIIQALVIVFSVAGMALTKLPEFQAWRSRVFHGRKAGEA